MVKKILQNSPIFDFSCYPFNRIACNEPCQARPQGHLLHEMGSSVLFSSLCITAFPGQFGGLKYIFSYFINRKVLNTLTKCWVILNKTQCSRDTIVRPSKVKLVGSPALKIHLNQIKKLPGRDIITNNQSSGLKPPGRDYFVIVPSREVFILYWIDSGSVFGMDNLDSQWLTEYQLFNETECAQPTFQF